MVILSALHPLSILDHKPHTLTQSLGHLLVQDSSPPYLKINPISPTPPLQVTLLHLKTVRSLMDPISDSHIISLITYVETRMRQTYGVMSMGQLHLLRQTLQRFFLGQPRSCRALALEDLFTCLIAPAGSRLHMTEINSLLTCSPPSPCFLATLPPPDKRVKVSLFLQEGIQSSSGRLILPSPNADRVGTVTIFTPSGAVKQQDRFKLKSQQVQARSY